MGYLAIDMDVNLYLSMHICFLLWGARYRMCLQTALRFFLLRADFYYTGVWQVTSHYSSWEDLFLVLGGLAC